MLISTWLNSIFWSNIQVADVLLERCASGHDRKLGYSVSGMLALVVHYSICPLSTLTWIWSTELEKITGELTRTTPAIRSSIRTWVHTYATPTIPTPSAPAVVIPVRSSQMPWVHSTIKWTPSRLIDPFTSALAQDTSTIRLSGWLEKKWLRALDAPRRAVVWGHDRSCRERPAERK